MPPQQTPLITGTPWMWAAFIVVVLAIVLIDMGIVRGRPHEITPGEAGRAVGVCVAFALLFGGVILLVDGRAAALTFATGYVLEEALSVDNIFVMVLVFAMFSVPSELHRRVLSYGVLGAIVMRGAFIGVGLALVAHVAWITYVFGAMLLYAGVRAAGRRERFEPDRNPLVRLVQRVIPLTGYEGDRFTAVRDGRRMATPLLLVVVVIELTDLLFATDSIPAIFSITRDPFLVFTSNILAVLGLRSLYFLLASAIDRLSLLKYGLALILVFVGLKMLGQHYVQIGTVTSLSVIVGILLISALGSLVRAR